MKSEAIVLIFINIIDTFSHYPLIEKRAIESVLAGMKIKGHSSVLKNSGTLHPGNEREFTPVGKCWDPIHENQKKRL